MSGGNFLQFIAAVMAMVTQTHRYAEEGISQVHSRWTLF